MGPWSEENQIDRAEKILAILNDPSISDEAFRIWSNHLNGLSKTQEIYEMRARSVYEGWITDEQLESLRKALR